MYYLFVIFKGFYCLHINYSIGRAQGINIKGLMGSRYGGEAKGAERTGGRCGGGDGEEMLKQIVEFVQKVPEMKWGEERLKNHLEESKKKFFFAVNVSDDLMYGGFHIVGIENSFLEEKEVSKRFVNLENWMNENKHLLKYTEFKWYREPLGGNNYAIGGANGLGTQCLSHLELQNIGEKTLNNAGYDAENKVNTITYRDALIHVLKTKTQAHVKAINDEIFAEHKIGRVELENLYIDFFKDLFNSLPEESFKQILKHEVIFSSNKLLGVKQEGKTKKDGDESRELPKYFNVQKAAKKPFVIESRTRPTKENILISKNEQKIIHEFMVRIFPDIGTPFILPLEEELQKKMAGAISSNEKNFFKTVENLLSKKELNSGTIARFDFYFIDIRGGEIYFFDYVSNYQYDFPTPFYNAFPLAVDIKSIPFNRRDLKENFSKMFGQKNLSCLPWVDLPKNMNTSKKSVYVQLREKMFETIYLGKRVLTESEIKNLCIMLIEDSIINEDDSKAEHFSNKVLNMFINHSLYTISGESVENSLISKAREIEEQISTKKFNPLGKESGFYLLGLLLKRLCDKSETSNEKSRLLQPIINTHNISGLTSVVTTKFVEKYAYKIEEKDSETRELINKVLPFFAEQDGEEPTKDFKLWLYAGFFSNNEMR